MLKTLFIGVVIVFLSYNPYPTIAQAPQKKLSELTPKELAEHYTSISQGEDKHTSAVIRCESNYEPSAKGDYGLANNVGQFHEETFYMIARKMGEKLNYDSYYDQTKALAWSLANGYGNLWTTYRAIKNGGVYTFYSKKFDKWYTVKCKA